MLSILGAFLLLSCAPALEIRPAFDVAHATWRATHIVIADEGAVIDGKLTVTRTLRGDLRPGRPLVVPELARYAEPAHRAIHDWVQEKPRKLRGREALLFLVRTPGGWKGAGWGDAIELSVAWLEPEGPHARLQVVNPGPVVNAALAMTTRELVASVLHLSADRDAVERAEKLEDLAARARELRAIMLTAERHARDRIPLLLLDGCRAPGREVVAELLRDEAWIEHHPLLLWALQRKHPGAGVEALHEHLERELAFWKAWKPAPHEMERAAGPRSAAAHHYRRAHRVLSLLHHRGRARGDRQVRKMLDFWAARPELDEWLRYTVGYPISVIAKQIEKP